MGGLKETGKKVLNLLRTVAPEESMPQDLLDYQEEDRPPTTRGHQNKRRDPPNPNIQRPTYPQATNDQSRPPYYPNHHSDPGQYPFPPPSIPAQYQPPNQFPNQTLGGSLQSANQQHASPYSGNTNPPHHGGMQQHWSQQPQSLYHYPTHGSGPAGSYESSQGYVHANPASENTNIHSPTPSHMLPTGNSEPPPMQGQYPSQYNYIPPDQGYASPGSYNSTLASNFSGNNYESHAQPSGQCTHQNTTNGRCNDCRLEVNSTPKYP